MAKSAAKSVFSLHSLPVISHPKPPSFVRFGHFGGKIHLLRGVFLFSSRDFLARNLILRRKNQFDEEIFCSKRPKFNFCRREKRESRRFFHLTTDGTISKRGRFCPKTSTRTKKHKTITKKTKDKIKKQAYYTEETEHKQAREIVFLSLPHSVQKIHADFLSKLLHFSRLPPLFLSKPPYPTPTPLHSYAQDTRLRVYTRLRTQRISHFCLHLTPQQAVDQPLECEGKPFLHLHRNNLKNNTLHDIRCKKTGEGKRVKPSPATHTCSTLYTQKVKR